MNYYRKELETNRAKDELRLRDTPFSFYKEDLQSQCVQGCCLRLHNFRLIAGGPAVTEPNLGSLLGEQNSRWQTHQEQLSDKTKFLCSK